MSVRFFVFHPNGHLVVGGPGAGCTSINDDSLQGGQKIKSRDRPNKFSVKSKQSLIFKLENELSKKRELGDEELGTAGR